jgi:hypothetical protein
MSDTPTETPTKTALELAWEKNGSQYREGSRRDSRDDRLYINEEWYQNVESDLRARFAADSAKSAAERLQAQAKEDRDFCGEIGSAIDALETAVVTYQQRDEAGIKKDLTERRAKINQLRWEIESLTNELQELEAKADWRTALDRGVAIAERNHNSLLEHYTGQVRDELVQHFLSDNEASYKTAPDAIKEVVRAHGRLRALRKFQLMPRPRTVEREDRETGRPITEPHTAEYLVQRAEEVYSKLASLRAHIENEAVPKA